MDQTIGFSTSHDGTRIAYAIAGSGPPIVRTATFMTHVEADQDSSVWGHLWRELARENTLIRYDQRGTGLSSRNPIAFSLEARVQDLEAVVDTLRLDKFILFGHSHGAVTAIEYAAKHPERIERLILLGAFAQRWAAREVADASITFMRTGWHREPSSVRSMFAIRMIPKASPEVLKAATDLLAKSMTGDIAASLADASREFDVLDRLPHIRVPTLVLHADAEEVPQEQGRLIASLLPNAKLVLIPSVNHVLPADDPGWTMFKSAVRAFLHDPTPSANTNGNGPSPIPAGLSAREAQVLAKIADGLTDKAIADDLGIATRTVGQHVNTILRKTESANRAQAAAWAARNGLA